MALPRPCASAQPYPQAAPKSKMAGKAAAAAAEEDEKEDELLARLANLKA
jgi:hypothetical protein